MTRYYSIKTIDSREFITTLQFTHTGSLGSMLARLDDYLGKEIKEKYELISIDQVDQEYMEMLGGK